MENYFTEEPYLTVKGEVLEKRAYIFYRVGQGDPNGGGMWYNSLGGFHGSMNMPKFKDLQCHCVEMPHDKDIVGYLSVAESLESLKKWFNDEDMKQLEPFGFKIEVWAARDYKEHNGHWIINKETSKMVPELESSIHSPNFRCPNCKEYGWDYAMDKYLTSTLPIFNHAPDPHLSWTEYHKCKHCNTLHHFENGT